MEKKYINESRYKKGTSRKRRDASTVRTNMLPKKEPKIVEKKQSKKVKTKKRIRKNSKESKVANIVTCIIFVIIIAVISRAILKDENEPFIPLPFFQKSNEQVIKIGVITTDSLLEENTNNIVINEINKYSKDMLLNINTDYSIDYRCISSVEKVSNKEYIVTKNKESNVTVEQIRNSMDTYKTNETSIYYNKLKNIESIAITNIDTLNIKLKEEDPYFIYKLDIPLNTSKDLTQYIKDSSSTDSMLVFERHKEADKELPLQIIVTRYKDVYAAVAAYKEQEINMFVTNAENVQTILGKYEYNITTYRNGQNVFLFGNPKSEIFSRHEVRQAIAYSINRDGIIQEILKSKGAKIDLPYIYDNVKYKYDIYAAENILLTNGYKKTNKVYSKTENGAKTTLELDLIVNKDDEIKVSIANKIKNNLGSIGIKVNVEKLTEAKLKTRVNKGSYDLILANVNLNNSPDISFLENNLYTNKTVKLLTENIYKSNVQDLRDNISLLQTGLSEQISAIGIYSDVSYLIYSKDIIRIDNISYMNIFSSIFS